MAHFAKLNNDNLVVHVSVVDNVNLLDENGVEQESVGISYLTQIHDYSNWKQTSYNGNIRKRVAGIGYIYYPELDAFISPKPYPSWSLDETLCDWIAPVARPAEGSWSWNELNQAWEEIPNPTNPL
jgi:hypothetical protein